MRVEYGNKKIGMGESGFMRRGVISTLEIENSISIEHVIICSVLMIKGEIPTTHFYRSNSLE